MTDERAWALEGELVGGQLLRQRETPTGTSAGGREHPTPPRRFWRRRPTNQPTKQAAVHEGATGVRTRCERMALPGTRHHTDEQTDGHTRRE